jgi:predicted alpha/beta hydrolase family esterase
MLKKPKNVVLIKGYGPSHDERWQHQEESHAREQGLRSLFDQGIPGFQEGDTPSVDEFIQFMDHILGKNNVDPEETIVLAHSLGGNGWLHFLAQRAEFRTCLTRLFGTPLENRTGLAEVDGFFPTPAFADFTPDDRRRIAVIGSDNDSIIKEGPEPLTSHLECDGLEVPGAGHFMPAALHQDSSQSDLGREWGRVRGSLLHYLPY